ncbi:MAG: hypothetical protein IH988_06060 [Planctomycetes bacterium]|nr:hypothetical protein [Planctomycetota bacterium]
MTTIGKYATALVVMVAGVCTLTDSALAKRNPKLDQVPVKVSGAPADSPSGPDMTSRGGESCDSPAQCDGDANGDGAVDPLDSGAILARFGLDPCVGGNLQYDVNCDGAIDPLDAGYVLARFGTCNPVTLCYPCDPPPNDDCENAIEAFLGDTPYCTGGATKDGPDDCPDACPEDCLPGDCPDNCGVELYNTGRSDIWFFHEVTKDGNIEIGQCLTTDPNYDPTISVYDGSSCPVGAPLACSDDGCGTGGGPGVVTIFAVEVGDLLLIRVGGWNDLTKGEEFNVFEQGEGILTIKDHGGPCCLGHDLPGCDFYEEGDAAEIEACVCNVDPFCCNVVWDDTCVLFVGQFCAGVCLANDDCEDNIPIVEIRWRTSAKSNTDSIWATTSGTATRLHARARPLSVPATTVTRTPVKPTTTRDWRPTWAATARPRMTTWSPATTTGRLSVEIVWGSRRGWRSTSSKAPTI